jgi:hypothetical protein
MIDELSNKSPCIHGDISLFVWLRRRVNRPSLNGGVGGDEIQML